MNHMHKILLTFLERRLIIWTTFRILLYPLLAKRGFVAFVPALASLVTIAVESIGSFLQKKHYEALSKGLNAIKSDQLLTWNSIKQC